MSIRFGLVFLSIALAVLLAGLLTFALPERTYACSCRTIGTPSEELENSAAVFRGTVTAASVSEDKQEVTYEFEVTTVWKGPLTGKTIITSPRWSAACGREYGTGEYIVYSWNGSRDGLCSRTRLISDASEDLAELGEGQVPSSWVDFSMVGLLVGVVGLIAGIVWLFLARRRSRSSYGQDRTK